MSASKKIGAWIGVALGSIALLGSLWTGFKVLDGLQDTDESLKLSVAEIQKAVVRFDSLTTANDRYRKRMICRDAGYVPGDCPLLKRELGGEDLEPSERAKLPEIP